MNGTSLRSVLTTNGVPDYELMNGTSLRSVLTTNGVPDYKR